MFVCIYLHKMAVTIWCYLSTYQFLVIVIIVFPVEYKPQKDRSIVNFVHCCSPNPQNYDWLIVGSQYL